MATMVFSYVFYGFHKYFDDQLGRQGGCASSRLDRRLKCVRGTALQIVAAAWEWFEEGINNIAAGKAKFGEKWFLGCQILFQRIEGQPSW